MVYKADGSTKYRVKIGKNDSKKLRMTISEIRDVIISISKSDVDIVFE